MGRSWKVRNSAVDTLSMRRRLAAELVRAEGVRLGLAPGSARLAVSSDQLQVSWYAQ